MPSLIDMTGWLMSEHGVPDSRLKVIGLAEPTYTTGGNKVINWLCECLCDKHSQLIVPGNRLRNGNTKSCGCLRRELLTKKNIDNSSVKIGQRYGKLTVIEDLGLRSQSSRNKRERWSLCQCDCGSEPIEVKNNMLQNGWKKSCGCLQSQGEFIISKLFQENNINFIKEYKIPELISPKGFPLRFDFAVFENNNLSYLLEFDGRQHYTGPEATWKNTHSLEEIQEYDNIKNLYCNLHNIVLKRIPYYVINNITYEDIQSDKYNI